MKKAHSFNPIDRHSATSATTALAVYRRICDQWELTAPQRYALLGVARSTWYRWEEGEGKLKTGLDAATIERLSYVMRIYAALALLLPVPAVAHAWVKQPNSAPLFGGRPALERMLAGNVADLFVVAEYLDAQRGGEFA